MALVWQMYRLQVNLPNLPSCFSNFIKSFIKIFETLVEYICCEIISADDIAIGEAARMSDKQTRLKVRIYLITNAILLTVGTRLRLPTEILLKGLQL